MLEQIGSGERDQSAIPRPQYRPTTPRWRSLAAKRPEVAAELHPTRNEGLDPGEIGTGTRRRLWWRCHRCGHEWQASPNHRCKGKGHGCPVCGKRRTKEATIARNRAFQIPRERSIAVIHPDLLRDLHPTQNGKLDPYTVAAGSDRKLWWRCHDCRHEWQAAVGDRA